MTKVHRHQQILLAAQDLFCSRGYENVTIADVIAASNIARGTFYLHFDSLEQLLGELFTQAVEDIWRRIAPLILDESMDFQHCAGAVLRASFDLFSEASSLGRVFVAGGGPRFRKQRQEALFDRLGRLIVQASEQHHAQPIPHLEWTVAMLIALMGEMAYYAATHHTLQDDESARLAFQQQVVDFALAGLARQVQPYVVQCKDRASEPGAAILTHQSAP